MACTSIKTKSNRVIFFGWNNLSEFELTNLQKVKDYVEKELHFKIPEYFDDREQLKFVQAYEFNTEKAGLALVEHIRWRNFLSTKLITPHIL